jgi:hypothetical protein
MGKKIEKFFYLPNSAPLELMTQLIFQHGRMNYTNTIKISYKFYGELVNEAVMRQQRYGIHCLPLLRSLRSQMQLDLKHERSLAQAKRQTLGQFAGIGAMTWILILVGLQEFSLSRFDLAGIFLWQVTGLMFFILLLKHKYQSLFWAFPAAISSIITYENLSIFEMSQKDKLDKCQWSVAKWPKHIDPFFSRLANYFQTCLIQEKQQGLSIREECQLMVEEIWSQWELTTEKYIEYLQQAKMVFAVIFFLSSFLWLIYRQASLVNF